MQKKYLIPLIIGIALIVIIASGLLWVYKGPAGNTQISVIKALHIPVARVGSHFIDGKDLFTRYEAAALLYKDDSNFTPRSGQKDILDRLIQTEQLQVVASRNKISVSADEINTEYERFADQQGGTEALNNALQNQYHLTPEQFKEASIAPDLLKTKMAIAFYKDASKNKTLYETLEIVQQKLKQGIDFGEVAKQYSEDPTTTPFGGDSGEIAYRDLSNEFQSALKTTQAGETVTFTTKFGVYVVKMINRKDDPAKPLTVHFQAIYLDHGTGAKAANSTAGTETTFTTWYTEQLKSVTVQKFIRLS